MSGEANGPSEGPGKGGENARPVKARWPLAMVALGVVLTALWAGVLLWGAAGLLDTVWDALTEPDQDPVEELWSDKPLPPAPMPAPMPAPLPAPVPPRGR